MQNIQDIEIVIGRLITMRNSVQALRQITNYIQHVGTHAHLDRIWDESCLIHKQLCEERVVLGYWEDAIEQAHLVSKMILDFGDDPTPEQLLGLGMATELLGQRIDEYKVVANMAAQCEIMTGERHGLDRAAA